DALGRATQVTYQDGSISTTDYSNLPAVTVTDQAGKLRGSRTDALGRLVEVDEPGAGANTPGTPGSGSITISGALQSSTTSGTKATGWFSVSGSDDYVLNCPPDLLCSPRFSPKLWDSGAVYVSVNGVQAGAGYGQNSNAAAMASSMAAALSPHPITFSDPGTGTISVTADTAGPNYSLSWSAMSNDPNDFGAGSFSVAVSGPTLTGGVYPVTTYDAGTLTVTVNGFQASAAYNQNLNSTPAALATALAAALNVSGSPVTASASSSTITLTSKAVGTAADYSVSGSSTASFTASGTTLSGGTDPGGLFAPLVTQYQYDGLGNLLRVDQKGTAPNDSTQWRTRTFTYDSLSRILTSSNPESGTITYSYDLDGNLLQKTSPAPNQTGTATQTVSYCYDALHRVTGKGYGAQSCPLATPVVSYTYDVGTNAKGHLTSLTDQAGTASYTYDNLGRLTTETRPIAGVSKSTSYTYNLDGSVKTLTYPSTRVVTYAANSAGRLVSVVDANGANYGMSGTHWPDGALKTFANGSTPALNQNFQYTPRLQLCRITALTSGTLPTSCTDTLHTGNIMDRGYDFHAGNGTAGSGTDNSNVFAITNYRDATRSQAFTYDALNRLSSGWSAANTGAYSWGESYSIDAWGNLQVAPMQNKAHGGNFANSSDLTNHPIGLGYDAAGNMTNYTAPGQYVYDAENRLSSAAGMSYTYDGNGERVLKFNTSTGAAVKRYWSIGGNTLAEGDGSGSLSAEYIYFGGKRIARIDLPANTVHYYLSDHLDSTSIIASAAGTVEEESDYYPFGTEVVVTAGPNSRKFTGKERDTESGLDNFGARYYGSALGRFVSADPVMIMRQRMFDPQQWNMYAYARNNPLRFKDENGKWPTPVHETIIDRAFPGLTPGQRALMKEYSAIQDQCPTCQMKSHNHQHYMKSPGEDPVKAKQAAESYIKQHEQAAQKEQGGTPAHAADINARSINEFTQAEHAVTDGTSPAHVDANGMPRDWNGIPITSGDWDKVHQHEAEEADPTPEQLNNAINTAQQAFKDSYGEQAYQEAITPPPSQKKEEPK
ncbi:MAG: RHS repeat-associated core domain-containing protein, partial [Candidatus Angelobacter sp.]